MIEIKKECTGCMACVNACPVDAIKIIEDRYGFVMPQVDEGKCIGCDKCIEVCPINGLPEGSDKKAEILRDRADKVSKPIKAYSMFHKTEEIVRISSSGGVFYALADRVISEDGIAFGCYYDITKKEAYLSDTDSLSLKALLTSKYVESYIGVDGMRRVRKELDKGRKVLFMGTPCQAAGLRGFLEKDYPNLLVADFACGGVAAQPYLSDYLKSLEERYSSKLVKMSFRDKHYGWGQYSFLAEFENGQVYRKTAMADPYFFCFLRSSMQRLSCHGCHFSDDHRSDICLSDFWRCDFFDVDRNDRKGISLALAFSSKGLMALEELKDVMHMEELDIEGASYHLRSRFCPEEKLEEIYRDMSIAKEQGVEPLRNMLLTEEEREFFEKRQNIMDDSELAKLHPDIVGSGQIVSTKQPK